MKTPGYRDCLDYFNDVYDATYSDMLRYALVKARCAEDVEDLLQNTYAKFFRRIRQHGHADIGNARAFLVTLLHKELARYYRFHAVRSEAELRQDLPPAAATQPAAETLGVTALTLSEVWDCVRSMPPLSQKVFLLYYGLDQPIAQIAQALSLSETAVKSRLHRARAFVRVQLGVAGQPEGAARTVGARTPGRGARTLGAPGPT